MFQNKSFKLKRNVFSHLKKSKFDNSRKNGIYSRRPNNAFKISIYTYVYRIYVYCFVSLQIKFFFREKQPNYLKHNYFWVYHKLWSFFFNLWGVNNEEPKLILKNEGAKIDFWYFARSWLGASVDILWALAHHVNTRVLRSAPKLLLTEVVAYMQPFFSLAEKAPNSQYNYRGCAQ